MAGTLTYTNPRLHGIQRLTFTWTADGSGDVNGTVTTQVTGEVVRVVTSPNLDKTQPDPLYDVTLLDEFGVDVLGGLGADRSDSEIEEFVPVMVYSSATDTLGAPRYVDGALELQISNAGDGCGGVVEVWLR